MSGCMCDELFSVAEDLIGCALRFAARPRVPQDEENSQ
jgi:hypothetical protein